LPSFVNDTVTITGFLLATMLVIEYWNVAARGGERWRRYRLGRSQYLVAAALGALPGCLGPWAVVSLYSHGLMSLGALVATMVATSGDEAFLMLALFPGPAMALFGVLLVLGVITGALTDLLTRGRRIAEAVDCEELVLHSKEASPLVGGRAWSRLRGLLAVGFVGLSVLIAAGIAGPPEWNWMRVALLVSMGFALFVVATVPDHFLEEHLWAHIIRRHGPRTFLWTLGALLASNALTGSLGAGNITSSSSWTMLVAACLIGVIPESGPHLVFVTLFAKGAIPMSVLLANSIVQDGHGMLPLLAESRRAFFITKAINLVAGFLIGAAALALGF
jgi:Putative, 10TM heavy-metal exporter